MRGEREVMVTLEPEIVHPLITGLILKRKVSQIILIIYISKV